MIFLVIHKAYMPVYKWSRFFLRTGPLEVAQDVLAGLKRQTQTQTLDSSSQPPIKKKSSHLSCTGSHITRICCISAFMSHIEHITCICCICVYIGSGDASESFQQGSHSSFPPLNSTIHGVLFSAFYENSLPNNNKEHRHSICVPTYYHISLVIYWETQADGRCYFLADSFLYFLLLLILSVV